MALTTARQKLGKAHSASQCLVVLARSILDLGILNRVDRTAGEHWTDITGVSSVSSRIVLLDTRLIAKLRTTTTTTSNTTTGATTAATASSRGRYRSRWRFSSRRTCSNVSSC
jgi:predicted transcriptional regulator of viral defense system